MNALLMLIPLVYDQFYEKDAILVLCEEERLQRDY